MREMGVREFEKQLSWIDITEDAAILEALVLGFYYRPLYLDFVHQIYVLKKNRWLLDMSARIRIWSRDE